MKTIDEQINELLTPILAEAHKIDPRINSLGLIADIPAKEDGIYFCFHRTGGTSIGGYGIDTALSKVTACDPKAEKLAAIEKLKAELAELEAQVNQPNQNETSQS